MSDLSAVYDAARKETSDLLVRLSEEELVTPVPATAGWTVRDIAAHLAADASCAVAADFPSEFFDAFGEEGAVAGLNRWTAAQVAARDGKPIAQLLEEWDTSGAEVAAMMRGERPWPDGIPWFADRVLVTDLAVHQHDIFGALGVAGDREAPQVKIALSSYIVTMDVRLRSAAGPALRFVADERSWNAGGDEPAATVRSSRFELFRAMSGRRSVEQIRAYDWDGDPGPFIPFFYPYGVRSEALIE